MFEIVKAEPTAIEVIRRRQEAYESLEVKPVRPIPSINLDRWVRSLKFDGHLESSYQTAWNYVHAFDGVQRNKRKDAFESDSFYKRSRYAEQAICSFLSYAIDASTEVVTEAGRVDLVTGNALIEVKVLQHWKHGLGQVLAYSQFLERQCNALFLFGVDTGIDRKVINTVCGKFGVFVDYSFVFQG